MIGVRFRDLDNVTYEFALVNGRFAQADAGVDEWIEMRTGFAICGLVDAHAHLSGDSVESMVAGTAADHEAIGRHAEEQLSGGVLLVADKGARDMAGLAAFDIAPQLRPALRMAGPVVSTQSGYYPGFGVVVDPDDPVDNWMEAVAHPAASWIKLIGDWPRKGRGVVANFTEEALRAIVAGAHARGKRVAIHAAGPGTSSVAVAAGVDSIEHGLFITEEDLRTLGARGGAWVPTIAAMEGIQAMLGAESSGGRMFAQGLANVRDLLAPAVALGVTVLAGTDLHLGHGQVAVEGRRMESYGMETGDVVDALTVAGYAHLGVDRSFTAGAVADLVVVGGDPREDLSQMLSPLLVVRAGRIVIRRAS